MTTRAAELSIRPFLGAVDFNISRRFYKDMGFEETPLSYNLSVFKTPTIAFYLQDAYVKDWVDNTMVFVEVADVNQYWAQLIAKNLHDKYPGVRLTPIRTHDWGSECFVHDPSGILWHFGQLNQPL
jgi:hypothetical protein